MANRGLSNKETFYNFESLCGIKAFIDLCYYNSNLLIVIPLLQSKFNDLLNFSLIYNEKETEKTLFNFNTNLDSYIYEIEEQYIDVKMLDGNVLRFNKISPLEYYNDEQNARLEIVANENPFKLVDKKGNEFLYGPVNNRFRLKSINNHVNILTINYNESGVITGLFDDDETHEKIYFTHRSPLVVIESRVNNLVINRIILRVDLTTHKIVSVTKDYNSTPTYYNVSISYENNRIVITNNKTGKAFSINNNNYIEYQIVDELNREENIVITSHNESALTDSLVTDMYGQETTYYFENELLKKIIKNNLLTLYFHDQNNNIISNGSFYSNREKNGMILPIDNVEYKLDESTLRRDTSILDIPDSSYLGIGAIYVSTNTNKTLSARYSIKGNAKEILSALIRFKVLNVSIDTKLTFKLDFYTDNGYVMSSYGKSVSIDKFKAGYWHEVLLSDAPITKYESIKINISIKSSGFSAYFFLDAYDEQLSNVYYYDDNKNLIREIANNKITEYFYNELNQLVDTPNSSISYNNKYQPIIEKDKYNNQTIIEYDVDHNYINRKDTKNFEFDIESNTLIDFDNKTKIETSNYENKTIISKFDDYYDLEYVKEKELSQASNPLYFKCNYQYNEITSSCPRFVNRIYFDGSNGFTSIRNNIMYNNNQRIETLIESDPSNVTINRYSYTYDSNGQISNINLENSSIFNCTYDNFGKVLTKSYPNGTYSFSYNDIGYLTNVKYNNVDRYAIIYDDYKKEQIKQVISNLECNQIDYYYDVFNNVTKKQIDNNNELITYNRVIDKIGNDSFNVVADNEYKIINEDYSYFIFKNKYDLYRAILKIYEYDAYYNFFHKNKDYENADLDLYNYLLSYKIPIDENYNNATLEEYKFLNYISVNEYNEICYSNIPNPVAMAIYNYLFVFKVEELPQRILILEIQTKENEKIKIYKKDDNVLEVNYYRFDYVIDTFDYETISNKINVLNIKFDNNKIYLKLNSNGYHSVDDCSSFTPDKLTLFSHVQFYGVLLSNKKNTNDEVNYIYDEFSKIYNEQPVSIENLITDKTISTNLAIDDGELIPLHKSYNSTNNLKPKENIRLQDNLELVEDFIYDSSINQIVYESKGQQLKYKIPIVNSGTIAFNVKILSNISSDIMLLKLGNIKVYADANKKIYLVVNNVTHLSNYHLTNNYDNLSLTFSRLIASNSITTITYEINAYLNGMKILTFNVNSTTNLIDNPILEIYCGIHAVLRYENIYFNERELSSEEILNLNANLNYYFKIINNYNPLGLIIKKQLVKGNNERYIEEYEYGRNIEGYKIPNIVTVNKTNSSGYQKHINYSYNYQGKVTSIISTSISITTTLNQYNYDLCGRLINETMNCLDENHSISYDYDSKGQVIKKTVDGVEINYVYDTIFKGRLNSFGNKTFTYNSTNPFYPSAITKNGISNSLVFEGNRLKEYGTNISFDYYYNGLRSKKQIGNTSIYYYYDIDGKLSTEIRKTNNTITHKIQYLYDNNEISGLICNGIRYYYIKNLCGNIEEIINESGTTMVLYYYNGFGQLIKKMENPALPVDFVNPIIFKGYYYDEETSLYYITSRYYDPEIGRFISPDSVDYLDPTIINGLNLYAYCRNDPVNRVDPTGHFAISSFLIGLGISALIGAVVGAFSYTASEGLSYAITGEFTWSWAQFAGSLIGGAIGGAISMIPGMGTMAVAGITGALSTGIGMHLQNQWEGTNYSVGQILFTSTINGLVSASAAGIFEAIPIKGLNRGRGSYEAIAKQINTKFFNGTIKHISYNTFSKVLTYNMIGSLIGTGYSGIMDVCNGNDWLSNLFYQRIERYL